MSKVIIKTKGKAGSKKPQQARKKPTKKTKEVVNTSPSRDRPVIYEELAFKIAVGEDALSVDQCKDLIGWTDSEELALAAGFNILEPLLKDRKGKRIWCLNNVNNRPFYMDNCERLVQNHLMGRWVFNGEPIIIGNKGSVINGQHSLISCILAEQDRTGPHAEHWREMGRIDPITMEKVVVFGVEEDDTIINTMDTAKPRSLSDVIYRSHYFQGMTSRDRVVASDMLEKAIQFLWMRLGIGKGEYSLRQTNPECIDFLNRHMTLVKCVEHIFKENKGGKIASYLRPGMASGLLFLMAASATDAKAYGDVDDGSLPSEKDIDWSNLDRAKQFFVELASTHPDLQELRMARMPIEGDTKLTGGYIFVKGKGGGSPQERIAAIIKAWNQYVDGLEIKSKDVKLTYRIDRDKDDVIIAKTLVDYPSTYGIDLGDPKARYDLDDLEDMDDLDADDDDEGDIIGMDERDMADVVREEEEESGFTNDEPDEDLQETIAQRAERIKQESLARTRDDHPENKQNKTRATKQAKRRDSGKDKEKGKAKEKAGSKPPKKGKAKG